MKYKEDIIILGCIIFIFSFLMGWDAGSNSGYKKGAKSQSDYYIKYLNEHGVPSYCFGNTCYVNLKSLWVRGVNDEGDFWECMTHAETREILDACKLNNSLETKP